MSKGAKNKSERTGPHREWGAGLMPGRGRVVKHY